MSLPARVTPLGPHPPARGRGLTGGQRRWRTRPTTRALLAERVADLAREAGVVALEDRLMPQGRGRIDVLLAGPAGITVVGADPIGGRDLFAPSAFADEGRVLVGRGRQGSGASFFEFLYRATLR